MDLSNYCVSNTIICNKYRKCRCALISPPTHTCIHILPPLPPLIICVLLQGPGLACLERLLSGSQRQWPASCDEPPEGAPEALRDGVAAGSNGSSGSSGSSSGKATGGSGLLDAADVPLLAEAFEGDAWLSGGDGEGRVWLVGDKISIADIAVADLVSERCEGRCE